jgi:hypothetical protein
MYETNRDIPSPRRQLLGLEMRTQTNGSDPPC